MRALETLRAFLERAYVPLQEEDERREAMAALEEVATALTHEDEYRRALNAEKTQSAHLLGAIKQADECIRAAIGWVYGEPSDPIDALLSSATAISDHVRGLERRIVNAMNAAYAKRRETE